MDKTLRIRDLFALDVTRDIPPVVYFHEQSPQKLADEVAEYIITGGYPDSDPRSQRVRSGIHEQFVHLLQAMARERDKPGGPELPASWISGFYGSGKSSFAKLLGLALDGVKLPDGKPLAEALLRRDDSPRRAELVTAWQELLRPIEPIAVVFDIGAVARDNEHIHSAVLRQVQARLGYCSKSHLVAQYELKLERDGRWEGFLAAAQKTLGRPWEQARDEELVDDHFSHVMHVLDPSRYREPTSWIDSHAGSALDTGSAVKEVTDAIAAMLDLRGVGKTLFIVVDEVSQYVHQDEARMLKLQTFVSHLGQKLKGQVWLLATGQQKLEDTSEAHNIGKLKDRFPPSLRVHLSTTNIRDVVHKRLLKKAPGKEAGLRQLFTQHRSDLKLYGYSCEQITEEDFLEVYPMLPGHVELLLRLTSSLRTRSTRVQGDDHAIRGLLQLLGELFREQKLADQPVGSLVTLDSIYEVQQSALDPDVQTTLARLFNHPEICGDVMAQRVAKAVSLLELIQEEVPTTADLIAKCIYDRLGRGNQVPAVTEALEKLRAANLLSYSEKQGYKIQSSAGQEWQRERDEFGVGSEQQSELILGKLGDLIGGVDRPRYKGRPFPFLAFYSDGKQSSDVRIKDPRDDANVQVDFRYLTSKDDRAPHLWVQRSDPAHENDLLRDRLIWVVGDAGRVHDLVRSLGRSRHMIRRYENRRESLPREKQRLLIEEQTRADDLEGKVQEAVAASFLDGTLYFRGRALRPQDLGTSFAAVLLAAAGRVLPELYPHFTEIAITETELNQLLEPTLSGPSTKFLDSGLGILSLDAGKYIPTCAGTQPSRILQFISERNRVTGASLVAHFGGPPYGYPVDVARACLAGLLRAGKVRIRPEQGPEITSIRDPGTKDLFRLDRALRRAEFFPPTEQEVGPRDRVAICTFFKKYMDLDLERENDAIADAVFQQFPGRRERLRELEALLDGIPSRPPLPPALQKLGRALEECRRSRQVAETVKEVKKHLDVLRDGMEQLGILRTELSPEVIRAVCAAEEVRRGHIAQLRHADKLGEVKAESQQVEEQLQAERPWREIHALKDALDRILAHYAAERRALLNHQSQLAEAARARVKTRDGFERLGDDQRHAVLRPLTAALCDTSPEALHPTLVELRDQFNHRLPEAEVQANELLDELIAKTTERKLVRVQHGLSGRELQSREQLQRLLAELEERIGAQLDTGARVRLV